MNDDDIDLTFSIKESKADTEIKKEFAEAQNQENEGTISKHDAKEQKRQQREEERNKVEKERETKEQRKNFIIISLVIIGILGFSYFVYNGITNAPALYSNGPVHWHAKIELELCGESRPLTDPNVKSMKGPSITHTHGDDTMHMEGIVRKKEDIALGRFMDEMDVEFSSETIMEYTNGDICPNATTPGQVKMYVNDVENDAFREYVPAPEEDVPPGDTIRIIFE